MTCVAIPVSSATALPSNTTGSAPCPSSLNSILDALPDFARTPFHRRPNIIQATRKRRLSDNQSNEMVADFLANGSWNLLPEAAPGQLTDDKLSHACATLGLNTAAPPARMTWPDVTAMVHEPCAALKLHETNASLKRPRRSLDAAGTDDLIRDFLASGAWNDLKVGKDLDQKVSEAATSLGLAPCKAPSQTGAGPSTSLAATTWNDIVAMETEKTAIHAVTVASGTPIELQEKQAPSKEKVGGGKALFETGEWGSSSSDCISGLKLQQVKA